MKRAGIVFPCPVKCHRINRIPAYCSSCALLRYNSILKVSDGLPAKAVLKPGSFVLLICCERVPVLRFHYMRRYFIKCLTLKGVPVRYSGDRKAIDPPRQLCGHVEDSSICGSVIVLLHLDVICGIRYLLDIIRPC